MITYIQDSSLIITTKHITNVNYSGIPAGQTFPQYAESLTRIAADTMFTTTLMMGKQITYNDTAWHISHCMGSALMVHLYGDEDKALEDTAFIGQTARQYKASIWLPGYCDYLWTDFIPKDNSLTIRLKSGISF